MKPSLASLAQYFRIGLAVGICQPEEARDWALSIIDQMDEPPGEIIEASWHKPLAQLISDLDEVKGETDIDLVRSLLLARLALTLESANASLGRALRQAMRITLATGACDLYEIFDGIEDALHLAETRTYGTIAACREDFDKVLKENATLPLAAGQQ